MSICQSTVFDIFYFLSLRRNGAPRHHCEAHRRARGPTAQRWACVPYLAVAIRSPALFSGKTNVLAIHRFFTHFGSHWTQKSCCREARGKQGPLEFFTFFQNSMSFFSPPCCGKRMKDFFISSSWTPPYNDHRIGKTIEVSIVFPAKRHVWQKMIVPIIFPMLIARNIWPNSYAVWLSRKAARRNAL